MSPGEQDTVPMPLVGTPTLPQQHANGVSGGKLLRRSPVTHHLNPTLTHTRYDAALQGTSGCVLLCPSRVHPTFTSTAFNTPWRSCPQGTSSAVPTACPLQPVPLAHTLIYTLAHMLLHPMRTPRAPSTACPAACCCTSRLCSWWRRTWAASRPAGATQPSAWRPLRRCAAARPACACWRCGPRPRAAATHACLWQGVLTGPHVLFMRCAVWGLVHVPLAAAPRHPARASAGAGDWD